MSIDEAKDPRTTPQRLQALSQDPALAPHVAENPDTTKESEAASR